MSGRLVVRKTYKLYVNGAFPRSESGRTLELEGYNVARASRKDARDAVVAARKGFAGWSAATAYNRGQVLYRLAEMMETRTGALAAACSGRREVARAIDRVVWYAGLGRQARAGARLLESRRRPVLQLHASRADGRRRDRRTSRARARRRWCPACSPRSWVGMRWWWSRPRPIRSPRSSWPRPSPRPTCRPASSTCSPVFGTSSRLSSPRTWTSTRST